MERFSGSLVHRYALDVPADPGWTQPERHHGDSAGGAVDRDDASAGGGWQPFAWDDRIPVLPGTSGRVPGSHYGTGHRGAQGRGEAGPTEELASTDQQLGGLHSPADLRRAGAAGAANGGLVATGVSAPWANAPVARRRADGKAVVNPGGLRLGTDYSIRADSHRQGLHMNRPFLRFIRMSAPVVERTSPSPGGKTSPYDPMVRARTVGPINPRLRRLVKPFGQTDMVDIDSDPAGAPVYDPGPIGGDWAL